MLKEYVIIVSALFVLHVGMWATVVASPLHEAALSGNLDRVREQILFGANVNERFGFDGWRPLHYAAFAHHDNSEVVKALVDAGAHFEAWDNADGMTPLHYAAANNRMNILRYLVTTLRAHVQVANRFGDTPLHSAALFGYKDVVFFLLMHGADPQRKNRKGESPLEFACDERMKIEKDKKMASDLRSELLEIYDRIISLLRYEARRDTVEEVGCFSCSPFSKAAAE